MILINTKQFSELNIAYCNVLCVCNYVMKRLLMMMESLFCMSVLFIKKGDLQM